MKKIFFCLLLTAFGCRNSNNSNSSLKEDSSKGIIKPENYVNVKTKTEKDSGYLLMYKNDTLLQTMRVNYGSRKKINFILITNNILRNKKSTLRGIAEMDVIIGDPEEDEAEDGMAFLYDNWHYINGKCQLYMRISDSARYVRIFEFNCKKLRDESCPFESKGVLKRTDLN